MSTDAVTEERSNEAIGLPLTQRAPRISQTDVFRAADELLVDGHRPTIDRVRMRLGRGSPNTINDHLDAWWRKLGARLRDLPGREFSQLPERVAQTLQQLWNEALQGAHEVLQGTLVEREQSIALREQALEDHARQLTNASRPRPAVQRFSKRVSHWHADSWPRVTNVLNGSKPPCKSVRRTACDSGRGSRRRRRQRANCEANLRPL